jgi:uncharacterized protein (DUF1015 family)
MDQTEQEPDTTASTALLPFRGIRFRTDLAAALGPPTDIVSSAEARAWVRERPHSAVRLEIEDDNAELRFTDAADLLARWLREGVLAQDDAPAYYVYEQSFDEAGRRYARLGVFGLVPLDAPEVCVLPHEETWEENRQRRLQLLRDLHASISPVFLIYDSAKQEMDQLLDAVVAHAPDAIATDSFGNTHRLWVVSDCDDVERLEQSMRGRYFIIADGHHRFAAAQLYHEEQQTPETGVVLACCVAAHDPGIVIRPIHRLITGRDAIDLTSAMGDLAAWFDISTEPVGQRTGGDLLATLSDGDLPEAALVANTGTTLIRLRLRDWSLGEPYLIDIPEPVRRLDVSVITELVVRQALQIDAEAEPRLLTYSSDADDLLAALRAGRADLGLLMRPIRLEQVLAVARAHGKVPAKSTSFVPKVPLGLVMHGLGNRGQGTGNRGEG